MRRGIILVVMVLGWLFGPPSNVQHAKEAYAAKKYKEAGALYNAEIENYKGQEPQLNFNIGQCWMMQDSIQRAMVAFGRVTNSEKQNPQMASWAWNQVGAIFASGKDQSATPDPNNPGAQPGAANMPMGQMLGQGQPQQGQQVSREKLEQALQAFKDAVKADNDNDIARYNYELIKRKLQQQDQNQQQDQQQDQQQQDQQKQDQQKQDQQQQQQQQPENKENKGQQGQQDQQQGEKKDGEQMSQEEAERILAAMNANEKKFLQQIEKHKKHRTYNHDGPDW